MRCMNRRWAYADGVVDVDNADMVRPVVGPVVDAGIPSVYRLRSSVTDMAAESFLGMRWGWGWREEEISTIYLWHAGVFFCLFTPAISKLSWQDNVM